MAQVPEYLRKAMEWKRKFLENQRLANEERSRKKEEDRFAKLRETRQPPARVWRVGSVLLWEPPKTFNKQKPLGFWISEYRNGEWTHHGDYLLSDAREAQLFGNNPARVETKYNQQALYEDYYSPVVDPIPGEPEWLLQRARFYATEVQHGIRHTERWRRVLAAFGVTETKRGHGGRPPVAPLEPAMTSSEAQKYADQGLQAWVPVVAALRRLEGKSVSREDQIDAATRSYEGRKTKRENKPWVRPLRNHANMPDISTRERDESWGRVNDASTD